MLNNFEIELKEIKIILDPFKFQLNAKTIGPKIINKNEIIEIEYLKTKIPLVSLFNKNFLVLFTIVILWVYGCLQIGEKIPGCKWKSPTILRWLKSLCI